MTIETTPANMPLVTAYVTFSETGVSLRATEDQSDGVQGQMKRAMARHAEIVPETLIPWSVYNEHYLGSEISGFAARVIRDQVE